MKPWQFYFALGRSPKYCGFVVSVSVFRVCLSVCSHISKSIQMLPNFPQNLKYITYRITVRTQKMTEPRPHIGYTYVH